MKLQYLGDSKDSFKWDYHDFLMSELKYPLLNIALMMTSDDGGNHGKTPPSLYPARSEIIAFCNHLRECRSISSIVALPEKTGASYVVELHKASKHIDCLNRSEYFSRISNLGDQVLFIDPDNGFEPEKSISEKHVGYDDITNVLSQISESSVVSVFQHHRRKTFPDDFERIKDRLHITDHCTAIYWSSLMFVAISKSESAIQKVVAANKKYAITNAVHVIR